MRMWMIDPKLLCNKHLLGEHVETHMLRGCINKGISLKGYIETGLIDRGQIFVMHDLLAEEMISRGMKHNSPIEKGDIRLSWISKVDVDKNIKDLCMRGEEYSAKCPFHSPDNKPSFSINVKTGLWQCYAESCYRK